MTSSYQDWNAVTVINGDKAVKRSNPGEGDVIKKKVSNSNDSKTLSKDVLYDFDPEHMTTAPKVSSDLKVAIQQARSSETNKQKKKLTQEELDKLCCFPANTIKSYENGSAVIEPNKLNKIESVLGVKLPRPAKAKKQKS